MSHDTRSRIVAAARAMGYMPSLVARGLVTQRSRSVGLVVTTFADPFHSEIVQGVEEVALRHNYSIFLASTGVNADREVAVVRSFQSRQVDGIIVTSSRVGNRYAELLQETGIPIVLVNSHVHGDGFHAVNHDDYAGGCLLVGHLLQRGYRRIAYLGNARAGRADQERRRAWIDTLHAAGVAPELAANGPNGRLHGGAAGAQELLTQADHLWGAPPDALYCYNDTMAIGALSVLYRCGLSAPEDIAVTGFDDIDVAAYIRPPLTTLHQPRLAMGAKAMEILLQLLDVAPDAAERCPLPIESVVAGELIVREST
jgi:DNA-binding LacI/PurR family transcriptional regulator